MFRGRLEATGVVATVQVGGDGQAALGPGSPGIVENLLVGVQGFTGPVSGHFGEEPMFDRVPFGGAGWVVSHGDSQGERVGQLGLQFRLPSVTAIPIAAASVGEDENLA